MNSFKKLTKIPPYYTAIGVVASLILSLLFGAIALYLKRRIAGCEHLPDATCAGQMLLETAIATVMGDMLFVARVLAELLAILLVIQLVALLKRKLAKSR